MTFVNDPQYGNSSIEFDINGLFSSAVAKTSNLQKHPQLSLSCGGASKMLLLSLDEAVFNSVLEVYFKVIKTFCLAKIIFQECFALHSTVLLLA